MIESYRVLQTGHNLFYTKEKGICWRCFLIAEDTQYRTNEDIYWGEIHYPLFPHRSKCLHFSQRENPYDRIPPHTDGKRILLESAYRARFYPPFCDWEWNKAQLGPVWQNGTLFIRVLIPDSKKEEVEARMGFCGWLGRVRMWKGNCNLDDSSMMEGMIVIGYDSKYTNQLHEW